MESPAMQWALSFKRSATLCDTLGQLVTGVFFNEVMADIDPANFSRALRQQHEPAADGDLRECGRHNLTLLLEGLTNYYQDVLQAVLILELPVVNAIVRDPSSGTACWANNTEVCCVVVWHCRLSGGHVFYCVSLCVLYDMLVLVQLEVL